MADQTVLQGLKEACPIVYFPASQTDARERLQRWSDIGVEAPSAVVTPANEDEAIAVVRAASRHGLQIVVGGGGCAWFVPVDSKKVYLSLEKLKDIEVNTSAQTVTLGGGVRTGEVLEKLKAYDYYTFLAVLNTIGVVGSVIGGGFTPFNGIHGFAVDNVLSLNVITASGQKVILNHNSKDQEAKLFSAFLGAGQGLGIVTSMTMKAWPIPNLNMTSNKIWSRKLVFPGSSINLAAETFCSIKPDSRLSTSLMFVKPGPAPLIILSANFFGSTTDAETAASALLDPSITSHTLAAETSSTIYHEINNSRAAIEAPGHQKEMYTCVIKSTSPTSLISAFNHFSTFLDSTPDASRSYTFIGQWDPTCPVQHKPTTRQDFIAMRDRGILVQATAWYSDPSTKARADEYGVATVQAMRARDAEGGLPPRILPHNPRFGHDLNEAYTREMIEGWKGVKGEWDAGNLFWGPLGDDEHFRV